MPLSIGMMDLAMGDRLASRSTSFFIAVNGQRRFRNIQTPKLAAVGVQGWLVLTGRGEGKQLCRMVAERSARDTLCRVIIQGKRHILIDFISL